MDPLAAIKFLRDRGMSYTEIAREAHCSRITIYRCINGISAARHMLRANLNALVAKKVEQEKRSNAARKGHRRRKERRQRRIA